MTVVGPRLPYELDKIAYGCRLGTQGIDQARRGDIGEDVGCKSPPAQGKIPKPVKNNAAAKCPDPRGYRDNRLQARGHISTPIDRRILAPQL